MIAIIRKSNIMPAAAIFLLLLILSLPAAAGTIGVEVAAPEVREILPGEVCTLSLRISNSSRRQLKLTENINLPSDWKLINPVSDITINAGDSSIRLLSLYIDPGADRGRETITYQLQAADGEETFSKVFSKEIAITILPKYELIVTPGTVPEYIFAGDDYTVEYLIKNNSNTPLAVRLKLNSYPPVPHSLSDKILQLDPGETKTMRAEVVSAKDLEQKRKHHLYLKAEGRYQGTDRVHVSAQTEVDIIPRVSGSDDPYHRLPLKLDTTFVSTEGKAGLQLQMASSGPITEKEEGFIDISLKPPEFDLSQEEFTGKRGVYRLTYKDEHSRLDLGDRKFTLSYLTEKQLEGRGIEGKTTWYNLDIGAYYRRAYGDNDHSAGGALFLDYPLDSGIDLKAGILHRDNSGHRQQILTAAATMDVNEDQAAVLEYAVGLNESEGKAAYRGQINGVIKDLAYHIEHVKAEHDFPGRISDRRHSEIKLEYPLTEEFSLRGSYQLTADNPELNTGGEAHRREVTAAGLAYRFQRMGIYLRGRQTYAKDRQASPEFDIKEDTLKLDYRYWGSSWRFHNYYQRLWTTNLLTDEETITDSFNLWTIYQPAADRYYRSWLRLDVPAAKADELQGRFDVAAYLNTANIEKIELGYHHRQEEDTDVINSRYSASAALPLPDLDSGYLELEAGYNECDSGEDYYTLMVSMSLSPLLESKLPVSRRRIGKVRGRIYDDMAADEFGDKPGLEGVIVNINEMTAVTDEEGRFIFPALRPGDYYLDIDRSSLPSGTTAARSLPAALSIRADEEQELNLGITEKSSLQGRVLVYTTVEQKNLHDYENREGIIVLDENMEAEPERGVNGLKLILKKETGEVYRRQTDNEGKFNVDNLRPGSYELVVQNPEILPDNYRLKQDKYLINLAPGHTEDIELQVTPIKREMELLEQGEVQYHE